jgi:hypothetical protein
MLSGMAISDSRSASIAVYLEVGSKRVFAAALDWPGWCRSARDEQGALDALATYADRYAPVAREARVKLIPPKDRNSFQVVERIRGSATTDFGAPGEIPKAGRKPVTREEAARLAALVEASWRVLDRVVAGAPATLRKGPRGGGRDRDEIVEHILVAEAAYALKLDVRVQPPDRADTAAVAEMRKAILRALRSADGAKIAGGKGWPPRYAAQRIAWHALDHAWEIEDKRV